MRPTAVEIVQTKLSKEREKQGRRLEILLALFAVALAVPELVNQPVAAAILQGIGVASPTIDYPVGWLVVTQLIIILLVAVIVYLLLHFVTRR